MAALLRPTFFHNTAQWELLLPAQETVLKWMEKVPEGFIFCPKMSRFLTHLKKLRDPGALERFFGIFEPMMGKMGAVLIQLSPFLKFDYDIADYFFSTAEETAWAL
jgi:uncharacterized protein YecE (DUF72 family)